MKIVYIVEDYHECGGVERICSEKANILSSEYHHEVTFLSIYKDERNQQFPLNDGVKYIELNVPMARKHCYPLFTLCGRIHTLWISIRVVNKVINNLQPDIIFFSTTLCALLLPFVKTSAKKVYESHSARQFTPFHKAFFLMELSADAVICLTKGDAAQYRYAHNVKVIPNFINTPTRLINSFSTPRAVAVGRLENVKGFDILIDCWKEISVRHPNWTLDIYGEGSERQALEQQIERLGLSDKIKLKGRCSDMTDRYADYSLFLMTSRYEGLGMVLIESQACGLPAVTFDFEYGASDIIKDGVNGLLVPQGDRKAFITAVDGMISSEQLRTHCGQKAMETLKRFSRNRIMNQWIMLINQLCKK